MTLRVSCIDNVYIICTNHPKIGAKWPYEYSELSGAIASAKEMHEDGPNYNIRVEMRQRVTTSVTDWSNSE